MFLPNESVLDQHATVQEGHSALESTRIPFSSAQVSRAEKAIEIAVEAQSSSQERPSHIPEASSKSSWSHSNGNHFSDLISSIEEFPMPRPVFPPSIPTLHAIQEWEGYVIEVGANDFVARLIDLTANSSHEEEEAVIPLEEISDSDVAELDIGSIFRWVIGYERSISGTKKRVSLIVFRDLPMITGTELRDSEAWAEETIRSLGL